MNMKKIFLLFTIYITILVGCASNVSSWQEHYDLGIRYLNEGNYEEAIIAFTAAIEIDEKNVDAYLGRAEAYINSNDENGITNALADYNIIVEIDATCEEAYVGMANAYIMQGDYDRAREVVDSLTDEALKSRVTEGIEKTMIESMELAEIKLENVTHSFNRDMAVIEQVDGAIGTMVIKAVVTEPINVRGVFISSLGSEISKWSEDKINKDAFDSAKEWKEMIKLKEEFPFEMYAEYAIDENDLGSYKEVLLIGIDENYNPVGYTIFKGEVPGKEELFKNVEVVEALNYSRAVNPPSYAGTGADYAPHAISIPKINLDSEAANSFNEKIMNDYMSFVEGFQTISTVDPYLIDISYNYGVTDGLVAIWVNCMRGYFASYRSVSITGYYFDSVSNEEISLEEYLNRLNIDISKMSIEINNEIQNNDNPGDNEECVLPNTNSREGIMNAIVMPEEFKIIYEEHFGMGGPVIVKVTCPIENIKKS